MDPVNFSPLENPIIHDRFGSTIITIIGAPFLWCPVAGGMVELEDASLQRGTQGGQCSLADFWMAKYPVTNAQYQTFLDDPSGFCNVEWWAFSPHALQWRLDHSHPKLTAFPGDRWPRTRVSWFDSMAFCAWLTTTLRQREPQATAWVLRLPTEPEWQRAAVGDTGWRYPWGNEIDPSRGNYGNHIGHPTPVDQYVDGESPYGVIDLVGNVWEWCLTAWGKELDDLSGYTYRAMRGGAWNVSNVAYLRAVSRYGHPPRAQLNDGGFRIVCVVAEQLR